MNPKYNLTSLFNKILKHRNANKYAFLRTRARTPASTEIFSSTLGEEKM